MVFIPKGKTFFSRIRQLRLPTSDRCPLQFLGSRNDFNTGGYKTVLILESGDQNEKQG